MSAGKCAVLANNRAIQTGGGGRKAARDVSNLIKSAWRSLSENLNSGRKLERVFGGDEVRISDR